MVDRGRRRRRSSTLGVIATLGLLVGLVAVLPAAAGGAVVTEGTFSEFAEGAKAPAMDISGHAVMIRTADGRTIVSVHVEGLAPNTTYAVHVHKQSCANGEADGHYQHSGTTVDDQNEIWPGFTTNAAGIGNGSARNDWSAGAAAMAVVVHRPTALPNKIACADLR
jgi:hypothetical protein